MESRFVNQKSFGREGGEDIMAGVGISKKYEELVGTIT